jgi:ankyrin repeat protein
MYACEKGDTTIASSLINVRADPNIQDLNGRTALFYAMSCITDNRNTISVLLQSSMLLIIDIDSTISCKDGSTAIVWGIEKGSIENVRMLLTKHPKLLGFSYNGNNLLHIAICSKRLEIVKLLLEEFKNINFNALNYSGINPIDLSVQAGGEIARYVANELEENKLNKRANKNKYTKRMLLNNTGSSKDAAIFNLNPTREELNFTAEDKMISFATTEYQIKIVYT